MDSSAKRFGLGTNIKGIFIPSYQQEVTNPPLSNLLGGYQVQTLHTLTPSSFRFRTLLDCEVTSDLHLPGVMFTAVSSPSVTFPRQLTQWTTLSFSQHVLSCLQDGRSRGGQALPSCCCHPRPNLTQLRHCKGLLMAPMAILVYRWSFSTQQVGWIIKTINQSMAPLLKCSSGFLLQLNQSQTSHTRAYLEMLHNLTLPFPISHCCHIAGVRSLSHSKRSLPTTCSKGPPPHYLLSSYPALFPS